jgi:hypothetical protein
MHAIDEPLETRATLFDAVDIRLGGYRGVHRRVSREVRLREHPPEQFLRIRRSFQRVGYGLSRWGFAPLARNGVDRAVVRQQPSFHHAFRRVEMNG